MTVDKKKQQQETPAEFTDEQVKEAIDCLQGGYVVMEFSLGWLPSTKQIKSKLKQKMVKEVKAREDRISTSKQLFGKKGTWVKKAWSARQTIVSFVHDNTRPMAEIPLNLAVAKAEDKDDAAKKAAEFLETAQGKRLVRLKDIPKIEDTIKTLLPSLWEAVEELQNNYEAFLKEEEEGLGDTFRREDYPDDITNEITMTKRYSQLGFSLDLKTVAPEIFDALYEDESAKLAQVAKHFVGRNASDILSVMRSALGALGEQMILMPPASSKYAFLKEGVVKDTAKYGDEGAEDLEEGQYAVEVQYTSPESKDERGKAKTVKEWFGPFTKEELDKLNMTPSGKRNVVTKTVWERLKFSAEDLKNAVEDVGEGLGEPLSEIGQEISTLFENAGGKIDAVLEEIKGSAFFRRNAHKELSALATRVEGLIGATNVKPPRRRKITKMKKA